MPLPEGLHCNPGPGRMHPTFASERGGIEVHHMKPRHANPHHSAVPSKSAKHGEAPLVGSDRGNIYVTQFLSLAYL